MIDPKELRIGNLIALNDALDKRQYYTVHQLFWDLTYHIGVDNSDLVLPKSYFDPIPITPEWLERLGYKKLETDSWMSASGWCTIDKIGSYYQHPMGCLKIEYIHQLQNLYYCLTGQELTVKE